MDFRTVNLGQMEHHIESLGQMERHIESLELVVMNIGDLDLMVASLKLMEHCTVDLGHCIVGLEQLERHIVSLEQMGHRIVSLELFVGMKTKINIKFQHLVIFSFFFQKLLFKTSVGLHRNFSELEYTFRIIVKKSQLN